MKKKLPDVQNSNDTRNIALDKAGVRRIKYPITLRDKKREQQTTVANFEATVHLPKELKGVHMSRFPQTLEKYTKTMFSLQVVENMLIELKKTLEAEAAYLMADFPYFIIKSAPASRMRSTIHVDCKFIGELDKDNNAKLFLEVRTPVTTCCPCSKEISKHNAHNQKAYITIKVEIKDNAFIWIEDLIRIAEAASSAPLYTILKRPDEKHITELMYDNPKFVEDVARDVALLLQNKRGIKSYEVDVESFESIHNHSAIANIKGEL